MSKFPTYNFPEKSTVPVPVPFPVPFQTGNNAVARPPPANVRAEVQYLKDRCDAGNPESSIAYAMMLFKGVWDLEQMNIDSLCSCLQPPPADHRLDPYLVLPKDPARAVQILRRVYETAAPDQTFFKNQARDFLVFCQANGLAGFPAGVITYPDAQPISPQDADTLHMNGRSANPDASSPTTYGFIASRDIRPETADPIGDIFMNVAESSRDKSFWIGLISTILSVVSCCFKQDIILPGVLLILVFIVLPFGIFYYLFDTYGVKQKLPICDCQRIRLARELTFEEYPPAYSQNAVDPFDSSPVKNLLHIKQFVFWVYLFSPLIICALYFSAVSWNIALSHNNSESFVDLLWGASLVLFLVGIFTLAFEKKPPKSCEGVNDEGGISIIFISFFYCCLHDLSCHDQAFAIIKRWAQHGPPEYAQVATINKMSE